MNNTNNFSARESYAIAKQILYDAWIDTFRNTRGIGNPEAACMEWVENRKLSQSEIRLEVELSATNNLLVFGVTDQQRNSSNVVFATEQRLTLQDSLISSSYGIYVCNPATRDDVAFELCTYGNNQIFSAAAAAALNSTFYANGSYVVKVSNDVVAPYRGLFNHLYKGQTQQTAALGAGSPADQIRGSEDGQITQEPNLLLIGTKNYVPQIELKSNLTTVDEYSRAVLIYRGILAQNSTSIN